MFKICTKCKLEKDASKDYYRCLGNVRSECKSCTIKRNVKYQRKVKAWKHRHVSDDARRLYMRKYYAENKEKFFQYRSSFKQRNPEYYKKYSMLTRPTKNLVNPP